MKNLACLKYLAEHIKYRELAALLLLLSVCMLPWFNVIKASRAQQRIAAQVVRLHVLADSDSERDQQLKLMVKKEIVEYLQEELKNADSREEALKKIALLFPQLKNVAESVLNENGCSDNVEICLRETDFPEKTYGDMTFPKGIYTALSVRIGSGQGHNWWCILFPSLCYVDESCSVVPEASKEKLKESLSQKDFESLIRKEGAKAEYHFFLWDWLKGEI